MIKILNSDRAVFIGKTGSGKTTLVKYMLPRLNRVIAIDPKHTLDIPGFKKSMKISSFSKSFQIIARPKRTDEDKLFDLILKADKLRNVTIYVDELATLTEVFPESTALLADIARTGREKRVALWTATQRPRNIPRVFLTESEIFFIFRLRSGDDRLYVKGYAGDEALEQIPNKHFWYFKDEDESPSLLTLDLENKRIVKIK